MSQDSFLWLEEVHGEKALEWVESQNQRTLSHFQKNPLWKTLHDEALACLTHPSKPAFGAVHNGYVYNLHQDTKNKLGLWRRASIATMTPNKETIWESILDLDKLSEKEGISYFLMGIRICPKSSRCLVKLSNGGKDACIAREFDLDKKSFVEDGFQFPESKSEYTWKDENTIFWSSSYQRPTNIGYSSQVYECHRGQVISDYKLIHEVPVTHMTVWVGVESEGQELSIHDMTTWDDNRIFLYENSEKIFSGNPFGTYLSGKWNGRWVFYSERGWGAFPQGSLLIEKNKKTPWPLSEKDVEPIFASGNDVFLQEHALLKDKIYFQTSNRLKLELWEVDTDLKSRKIEIPGLSSLSGLTTNTEETAAFVNIQSFTEPPQVCQIENGALKVLQKTADLFDSKDVKVDQHWAKSADGTMIPYYLVSPKNSHGEARPTLQYGYGGFMAAHFPFYQSVTGKMWIEKGGAFALCNIRGGSEFGPQWHRQALKENRMKCYEDFIAISEDMIAKGLTTKEMLGIQGRSNGGLLAGATMALRPDLYKATVIEVPLLDMIRYTELPPGASWVEEYGDPNDPKIREVILKYSPYQNVKKDQKYPKAFIRTVRTDDRVHPGHARKMAALMQSLGHDCWFWEETAGGHGSHTAADKAFQLATVMTYLHEQLKS